MTEDDTLDDLAELEAMMAEEEETSASDEMGEGPFANFFRLGAGGVVNIFGDTGSGKTKICITTAIDAAKRGYRAIYVDLEGNIHRTVVEKMLEAGVQYVQHSKISMARKELRRAEFDVVIVDSVTHHITGMWYELDRREQGQLLQEVQNFVFWLSEKVTEKNCLAMIVSQPVSDFGGKGRAPMGDKMAFFCKETYFVSQDDAKNPMKGTMTAFKSRIMPKNIFVAYYETEKVGVTFTKWSAMVEDL